MAPWVTGNLLVASPSLGHASFRRTVVAILEHDDDGALGVVLNRASDVPVAQVLPDWADRSAEPGTLFFGGPVGTDGVLGLVVGSVRVAPSGVARLVEPSPGARPLATLVDLDQPETVPCGASARLFAGYAGWAAGQLEAELAAEAWFVVPALESDLVAPRWDVLWRVVLARQQFPLNLLAGFPDDPSLN